MILNTRSSNNLTGVHPDLVKVVKLAASNTPLDFIVTEGVRTTSRQAELVRVGASRTMKSRHITGHAVDLAALVGGDVRWDWPLYEHLGAIMKNAAAKLDIPITWGGDWDRGFRDGPHFQLTWEDYP